MESIEQSKNKEIQEIERKLKNASLEPNFWETWTGSASGALASMGTEGDMYIYPAENNIYGKGYGIKYGKQNFFLTNGTSRMLFNSNNDRITSKELELLGVSGESLKYQLNELIEKGLKAENEKPNSYLK